MGSGVNDEDAQGGLSWADGTRAEALQRACAWCVLETARRPVGQEQRWEFGELLRNSSLCGHISSSEKQG